MDAAGDETLQVALGADQIRGETMPLTAYGAFVVTLMMVFYALEARSRWYTFAFAISCLGSSVYGSEHYPQGP